MLISLPSYYKVAADEWTPAELFANDELGVWYEVLPEHLFQDEAGTVPVTGDNQPVRRMQDISGNGNHAIAPSDAARPLYRTDGTLHWLQPDGVDDTLVTPTLQWGVNSAMMSFALRKLSDSSSGIVMSFGNIGGNSGAFDLFAPGDGGARRFRYRLSPHGSAGTTATAQTSASAWNAPISVVASSQMKLGDDPLITLRLNGTLIDSESISQSRTAFTASSLGLLGSREGGSAIPYSGRFYGGVIVMDWSPSKDTELFKLEEYLSQRAGVTLT